MMPLSHVYVSTQVTGRQNPLLIFGSVLPDISFAPNAVIKRSELHNNPVKFMEFVKSKYPEFLELAVGVRLHSGIDKGADFYSDDPEAGFALREGRKIAAEVAALFGIEVDKGILVLSHNFIEAGVDINLSKQHPELVLQYLSVLENLDVRAIAKCLGEYQNIGQDIIEDQINKYIYFVSGVDESSKMAERIFVTAIKLRYEKTLSPEAITPIIDHAVKITSTDYDKWLQEAIENMKRDFAGI